MTPQLLIEITWKSSAIITLAWLLTGLLTRSSAAVRHLVWTIAFLGVLILPLIVLFGPAWRMEVLPQQSLADSELQKTPASEVQGFIPIAPPETAIPNSAFSVPGSNRLISSNLILYLWSLGVILGAFRLSVALFGARRIVQRAEPVSNPVWTMTLSDIAPVAGLNASVQILKSNRTTVASTCGILNPRILVPADAENWNVQRVRLVLLHELAHIQRRDCLTQVLARLAWVLQWFNPLTYLAAEKMFAEQERACDDQVLASGTRASEYARDLLEIAREFRPGSLPVWGTVAMARPSQFAGRLKAILDESRNRGTIALRHYVVFVMLGLSTIVPLGAVQFVAVAAPAVELSSQEAAKPVTPAPKLESEVPAPAPQSRQSLETRALEKWLEEDVAYIISDQERAAFNSLATNEEREHFIEQFWVRRDPTPGTAENEFKMTHYSRIAYANERFRNTKPGWQTDRGRIYIMYGKPYETQFFAAGLERSYPFEVWTYRYLQGIGNNVRIEFVDPNLNGEFRLNALPEEQQRLMRPQIVNTPRPDADGVRVDTQGKLLTRPSMQYPDGARQNGIEGTVLADLTVDAAGDVTDARIVSGHEELRKAVLQSVLQWKFAEDALPRRFIQVSVSFQLPRLEATVATRLDLPEAVYRIADGVTAPRIIRRVDPIYTQEARDNHHQGTVVLEAIIRADGTVQVVRVVKSIGMGLDEQAMLALSQWQFAPGTRNGQPVNVSIMIEVNFNLK